MTAMWMVRGEGGRLYEDFRERSVAAIGWTQLAEAAKPGVSRQELIAIYQQAEPGARVGTIIAGASQVWRFVNEIQAGDLVVTYSPANRTYLIGNVTGPYAHRPEWADEGMSLTRPVDWQVGEVNRDDLSTASKNSLGSTLTVFRVPTFACDELLAATRGEPVSPAPSEEIDEAVAADPLMDVESAALERIKDQVNALDWREMQDLVAGILRAMGYRTQLSPAGADRGKDIMASPDGFGFEHPRIIVEVKHRAGQTGSPVIRSFLGGRHADDRGLFVSTGGFSKDAYYEADRAAVPLSLWTLDSLVRTLVDHYDSTDSETKRLVPLKRLYIPA